MHRAWSNQEFENKFDSPLVELLIGLQILCRREGLILSLVTVLALFLLLSLTAPPKKVHELANELVSTLANLKTKTQDEEKVVLILLRLVAWFILDSEQMFICDCFCL